MSWRQERLGGGDDYFDEEGRLIAVHHFTDYPAYCGSRSQSFGTVPTCPTQPATTALCAR